MNHFDILYIHPFLPGMNMQTSIPVGLIPTFNLLIEKGYKVQGVNLQLEKLLNKDFSLEKFLSSLTCKLVMIDLHWMHYSYASIHAARVVKKIHPSVPVMLGGITASSFANAILSDFQEVDFVLKGEAERCIVTVIEKLFSESQDYSTLPNLSWRQGNCIEHNDISVFTDDLDNYNFINIDFLHNHQNMIQNDNNMHMHLHNKELKSFWLLNARGCYHNCSQCGGSRDFYTKVFKRNCFTFRDPNKLLEDIQSLSHEGIDIIGFTRDIYEAPQSHWESILRGMKKYNMGVVNHLDRLPSSEFIDIFSESVHMENSLFSIGLVSSDEGIRRHNGRHFSNEELWDFIKQCRAKQIFLMLFFSYNHPSNTEKSLNETLIMIEEILEFYPSHLLKIGMSLFMLEPNSLLSGNTGQYNIDVHWKTFRDYYERFSPRFAKEIYTKEEHLLLRETTGFTNPLIEYKFFLDYNKRFKDLINKYNISSDIYG